MSLYHRMQEPLSGLDFKHFMKFIETLIQRYTVTAIILVTAIFVAMIWFCFRELGRSNSVNAERRKQAASKDSFTSLDSLSESKH